jgi:hypothetical protein
MKIDPKVRFGPDRYDPSSPDDLRAIVKALIVKLRIEHSQTEFNLTSTKLQLDSKKALT